MLPLKNIGNNSAAAIHTIGKNTGIWLKRGYKACLKDFLFYYTYLSILFKSLVLLSTVAGISLSGTGIFKVYKIVPTDLVYLAFPLILLSFAFLFKNKGRMWFLIIFNLFFSAIFMFDAWNFRGFSSFISLYMLKETANLQNLGDSIMAMIHLRDLVFVIDIPVLIAIAIFNKKVYKNVKRNIIVFLLVLIIPSGYLAYAHYRYDISADRGKGQYLFKTFWTPGTTFTDLSPIGYHLYDAFMYFVQNRQLNLSAEDKQNIQQWFDEKKENLPDNKYKGMFKGMNLIMIQVESLEGFYLNNKVDGQEITPNLNGLLKNSFYFPNFYEQVNIGTTSDAELMSNTSVYPVRDGATYFRFPTNTYNNSMPKLMKGLGYNTLAIHPDKGAYWNWETVLSTFGYDKCLDATAFKQDETIGLGLSDGSFLRQIEPIIKSQKQPFYTYFISLTSHTPFYLPTKYKDLTLENKFLNTRLGDSFQTVRYTDKQLGILLSKLQEDGILDNTVVVIYGDHSGVHKFCADDVKKIKPVDDWWADNQRHVPFIIYQNKLKGQDIQTIGGEIDILPTISYLMGVDEKSLENTAMGRNLFNTNKNFAVMVDGIYKGDAADTKQKEHDINGLSVADKIIRSDYFKNK
ncbi:MAG: LTA synthase family protein [Bacillota bacterium]|nr:LTA synthase family protein [Bacillota bacterium]